MEALKTFENLSDADKIKFFESLRCEIPKVSATTPVEKPTSTGLQNTDFAALIEHLKTELSKNSGKLETASTTTESKKKQKTLDGWVIKSKSISTTDVRDIAADVNNAGVTISPSKVNASTDHSTTVDSLQASSPRTITDSYSHKERDELLKANPSITSPKNDELCMSIRSSKRNVPKSCLNVDDTSIKTKTDAVNNDAVSSKHVENSKTTNDESASLPSNVSTELTAKNVLVCNSDVNSYSTLSSPDKSKKTYNLGTKPKIPKKFEQCLGTDALITCFASNQQCEDSVTLNQNTIENGTQSAVDLTEELEFKAYKNISAKCAQYGLNIHDILLHDNIQSLLSNYKDDSPNNAVILVGSHKSDCGKNAPVVHMHPNKFELMENLKKLHRKM